METGGLRTKGIIKQSQLNIPLITVVTVVYNGEKDFEETVLSVIKQTYQNVEYIVIDGASTDNTFNIIKKHEDAIDYWISEPDRGIYDAMNKGIDLAKGDWINFMNSGDKFYDKNVLKTIFEENTNLDDIIYGDVLLVRRLGSVVQKAKPLDLISKQMIFSHQAAFVRLTLMREIKYDTTFKSSGDYNFFYQCYKNNRRFLYVPCIIAASNDEYGVSRNYALVKHEDARIHGIEHTLDWKIKYVSGCMTYNIKQIIKRILPKSIVDKIRRNNIKRMGKV
jgi:glycosyltransferase involved in cell wall biosynthesis